MTRRLLAVVPYTDVAKWWLTLPAETPGDFRRLAPCSVALVVAPRPHPLNGVIKATPSTNHNTTKLSAYDTQRIKMHLRAIFNSNKVFITVKSVSSSHDPDTVTLWLAWGAARNRLKLTGILIDLKS